MALSKGKQRLLERLRNPRFRPREGYFVVEGVRACGEFLEGRLASEVAFSVVSPRLSTTPGGEELRSRFRKLDTPLEEVTDRELSTLSHTESSQGVLMVVTEPRSSLSLMDSLATPRVLLLDAVQDPGNAGTLIRAAQAFRLHGVFVLEGTVDPFNAKVVRASAGALAHLPVFKPSWTDAWEWLQERGVPLLVADAGGEDVRGELFPPPWGLVVGNEGRGPRREFLERAERVLAVRTAPEVDSLNAGVAGAILLFALDAASERGGKD